MAKETENTLLRNEESEQLEQKSQEIIRKLDKESAVAISSNDDGSLAPIYIWVTPDESRTVVGFSASIAVGSVVGRLVDSRGTKRDIVTIK